MDSLHWEGRVAEPQIQDTHAIASDLPQLLARNLTGVQSSQTQDLKFINLSHPDDLNRQQAVRKEIRRHVMKDIGQRRRRPRPKKMSPASQTPLESNDVTISQLCVPDIGRFSSSQCLDMLAHFHVEADTRSFELMHFRKSPKLLRWALGHIIC